MQRLTPLGKLFIVLLILAGLYGGFRLLQNQGIIGKGDEPTQTQAPGGSYGDSATAASPSTQPTTPSQPTSTEANTGGSTFSYTPPAPTNGKLKGVVEMGASGFNSFIVKIDPQKNWQLEKAEFGNS